MSGHFGGRSKCKAVMLFALGVLFFLGTLGVWPEFAFSKYWPLFLILWGLHGFCPCNSDCCGDKGGKCESGGGKCGGKCGGACGCK